MKPLVRLSVLRHREVFAHPYDVFSAVIETRRWGFGFRVHDWRDRNATRPEWGLRVQFWRWHLCWHFVQANNAVRVAAEPRTLDGLVGSSEVPK
jgi:hypothetical protein